jgi:hypothetical protein
MGTYSRPGSTPTSGTSRINPAMAALEAARGAQTKIEERVKGVRKFEQEAAERKRKLNEALANTQMLEEQGPFQGLETEFSDMVDRINKLDIASFDGNRAEYNEEYNNAMKILGDFQSIVGALDHDIDEYQDKSATELNKLISRSALKEGKTEEYRKLLNDPSKMGMRIQGNQLIITNDGKELFNGTSYLNSKEKGRGLVPYTPDMQPELDKTIKANYPNIKNLEKVSQIQKEINEGKQIKSEKVKYYADAYNAYKRRLKEDPKVDALVNESTYQRFVDPDGSNVYEKTKNGAETKEAIIQYMLERQFPDHEKVITVATTVKDVKKSKDKEKISINYDEFEKLALSPTGKANSDEAIKWLEKTFKDLPIVDDSNKQRFITSVEYDANKNEYVPIYAIDQYDKKTGKITKVYKELGSYSPTEIVNEAITLRVKPTQVAKDRLSVL